MPTVTSINPEQMAAHIQELMANAITSVNDERLFRKTTDELGTAVGGLLLEIGEAVTLKSGAVYQAAAAYYMADLFGLPVDGTAIAGQLLCRNGKALEDVSTVVPDRQAVQLREERDDPVLSAKAPEPADMTERKAFLDEIAELVKTALPIIANRHPRLLKDGLTAARKAARVLDIDVPIPPIVPLGHTADSLAKVAMLCAKQGMAAIELELLTGKIATQLGDAFMKPGVSVNVSATSRFHSESAWFHSFWSPVEGQVLCHNGKVVEDTADLLSDYEGFKRTQGYPNPILDRLPRPKASAGERCQFLRDLPAFIRKMAPVVATGNDPEAKVLLKKATRAAATIESCRLMGPDHGPGM